MKFDRINYSKMKLDSSTPVQKSYITLVQNNRYQKVTITSAECKSSVKVLSRMNNKTKK